MFVFSRVWPKRKLTHLPDFSPFLLSPWTEIISPPTLKGREREREEGEETCGVQVEGWGGGWGMGGWGGATDNLKRKPGSTNWHATRLPRAQKCGNASACVWMHACVCVLVGVPIPQPEAYGCAAERGKILRARILISAHRDDCIMLKTKKLHSWMLIADEHVHAHAFICFVHTAQQRLHWKHTNACWLYWRAQAEIIALWCWRAASSFRWWNKQDIPPSPSPPKPAIVGTVNMDWQSYYTGLQAADAFTLYTFTHFFSIQLATVNIIFLKHQASSSNFKNLLSIRQAQSSSKRGPFETDACPEGREGVAIRAREQQHLGREETLYTGTISKHWAHTHTHTHEIICHLHTCPVFGLFLLGKQHSMQQHGFIFERYTDRRCTCCILDLSIN